MTKKSIFRKKSMRRSKVQKSVKRKLSEKQVLRKTLVSLPKTRISKINKLLKEIKQSAQPCGSVTRGWSAMSPQRGKERSVLFDKCGKNCFLEPENLGYPICPALRLSNHCKVNCKGLVSAKIRASQNHNDFVLGKANYLIEKTCKKKNKKNEKL